MSTHLINGIETSIEISAYELRFFSSLYIL
jgi:hypothetical protein